MSAALVLDLRGKRGPCLSWSPEFEKATAVWNAPKEIRGAYRRRMREARKQESCILVLTEKDFTRRGLVRTWVRWDLEWVDVGLLLPGQDLEQVVQSVNRPRVWPNPTDALDTVGRAA